MMKKADIVYQQNKFIVSGSLMVGNVMSVYEKSLASLNSGAAFLFDFSAVKESDSTALALVIEWIKLANTKNQPIKFISLPANLIAIAQAANLEHMVSV